VDAPSTLACSIREVAHESPPVAAFFTFGKVQLHTVPSTNSSVKQTDGFLAQSGAEITFDFAKSVDDRRALELPVHINGLRCSEMVFAELVRDPAT
jgi:hypothetical protein